MEFFRIIDKQVSETIVKHKITPENLELFTESMFLIEQNGNNFQSATLWGEFLISYDKINGGVRFTLLDCPNALAWTITTGFPPEREKIVLHATINRTQKPIEFLEEVNDFLNEWEKGLNSQF
tara:strand:+ start:1706 stop:2074 length:369 start_codon:yes stop_codon:yes gene_type:complete